MTTVDESLAAAADVLYKSLKENTTLAEYFGENVEELGEALRLFLEPAFRDGSADLQINDDLFTQDSLEALVDVVLEALQRPLPLDEDSLVAALRVVSTDFSEDDRIAEIFAQLRQAVSVEDNEEADEDATNRGKGSCVTAQDVITDSLDELRLPKKQAQEIIDSWGAFLDSYATRELAGEAVYTALFDSAPSLQSLFKTPRAVMSMRFMMGINQIIMALTDPKQCKIVIETLGFQHLDLEVTVPRIAIFRDAILDLVAAEMGSKLTNSAADGLAMTLNYAGGGYIYIRQKFSERVRILTSSWRTANGEVDEDEAEEDLLAAEEEAAEEEIDEAAENEEEGAGKNADKKLSEKEMKNQQGVPTTYNEMFRFNAAVMGFANNNWMFEVLNSFDAMVKNIANSYRLQEECDLLALKMAKIPGAVKLGDYKAVMLASIRSLVPKAWDSAHEVAWNWLWDNVERMLKKDLDKPAARERYLGRFLGSLEEDTKQIIRQEVYVKFFALAPGGQDYFKQSTTRLYFIADKILDMSLDMYKEPTRMADDISALGLRHVGYGIPTEFFGPFVTGCVEVARELTGDETLTDAFGWSLGLISRVLTRTINEGSTIVMKAINTDNAKQVKKAISCAPRGKRAIWMLNITVGTQSISPLLWSISSGSLEAAEMMITDLLAIRADRDRYYYGLDELFSRHPDIVQVLTTDAPNLLPKMLDCMLWRSRLAVNGQRRVNYYIKHLTVDEEGRFADAMSWIYKLEDPSIATHEVLVQLSDLVWNKITYASFLLSKIWLLWTLVVFLFSQSIIKNLNAELTDGHRIVIFACRTFVYMFGMAEVMYSRTKYLCKACADGDLVRVGRFPVPRRYLEDWQEILSVVLTLCLTMLFWTEPILYCLYAGGDTPLFAGDCDGAKGVKGFYDIVSLVSMLCYFSLLIDFTALSTRLSAFVLLTGRVVPELCLTLGACAYFVITFGTSITATNGKNEDFAGIPNATITLFQILMKTYTGSKFDELQHSPWIMVGTCTFVVLTSIFVFNVLIAQLNCAYQQVFNSMVGYARINRMKIVCESMPSISARRFTRFVTSLRFDERLEFGEGDIGLSGGIQVLEAASAHPSNIDSILRFGGSTSPAMPWPEDEDLGSSEAERLERIAKNFQNAVRKMTKTSRSQSGVSGSGGDSMEDISMVK
eukprot:TRINITY_DN3929_c0_g1_i1.p1 TRINITY_DN3929_c0_g1~~TRINITY_DN3929_c0_g1_i1.p1  ORF type:complete len:1171 (-),score=241.12 TRINITY_DN3929_c0_g1_i1:233-3745(-)